MRGKDLKIRKAARKSLIGNGSITASIIIANIIKASAQGKNIQNYN